MLRVDRDALRRRLQLADGSGATGGLPRTVLVQRAGYWLRADVAPAFWRFFAGFGALLRRTGTTRSYLNEVRTRTTREKRRALALLCSEQLVLALQFAEDALACCVELASLAGGASSVVDELRTNFRCLVFEDFALKEVGGDDCVLVMKWYLHGATDAVASAPTEVSRGARDLLLHELPEVPRCEVPRRPLRRRRRF